MAGSIQEWAGAFKNGSHPHQGVCPKKIDLLDRFPIYWENVKSNCEITHAPKGAGLRVSS